jgi:hypothetical protein
MMRGSEVEEALMLKRIALLGAMAALTIVKPSNAVAQAWDGWGSPFPPFCCEEHQFFPRRDFCCEEHRFFPRRDFCCEERRFFNRPVFFEEHRFFPRPFWRPPYFYGDRFAPGVYNWNVGYTDGGYGYY